MGDLVDTLPAEYQTESLRSLPGDLKAIAVENIRKKFGLNDKSVLSKTVTTVSNKISSSMNLDDLKKIYRDLDPAVSNPNLYDHRHGVDMTRFEPTQNELRRRFKLCIRFDSSLMLGTQHRDITVDVSEHDLVRHNKLDLLEHEAYRYLEQRYGSVHIVNMKAI